MSEIIEFRKPEINTLIGRMFMLNIALAPKFQCGGFSVNSGRLIDVVTERTQLMAIQKAVENNILIDVTDNKIVTKGFELKNSSSSNVQTEDTDKKVFVGRDRYGRLFVIAPKDEEDRKRYEDQIATTGKIEFTPDESEEFTGFSPIIESKVVESSKD